MQGPLKAPIKANFLRTFFDFSGPYGPIRAQMGPYGLVWVHMGPYEPIWARVGPARALEDREKYKKNNLLNKTGLGRSGHVRSPTFGPISHVSGPTNCILTKCINDSASFFQEKLKNHIILTKNPNI